MEFVINPEWDEQTVKAVSKKMYDYLQGRNIKTQKDLTVLRREGFKELHRVNQSFKSAAFCSGYVFMEKIRRNDPAKTEFHTGFISLDPGLLTFQGEFIADETDISRERALQLLLIKGRQYPMGGLAAKLVKYRLTRKVNPDSPHYLILHAMQPDGKIKTMYIGLTKQERRQKGYT